MESSLPGDDTPMETRMFLEESDELERSGRLPLWPYVVRTRVDPYTSAQHRDADSAAADAAETVDAWPTSGPTSPVYMPAALSHDTDGNAPAATTAVATAPATADGSRPPLAADDSSSAWQRQHRSDDDLRAALSALQSAVQCAAREAAAAATPGRRARLLRRTPPASPPPPLPLSTLAAALDATDTTQCPQGCGCDVPARGAALRRHLSAQCASRVVTCPELGCGALVQARSLPLHAAAECAAVARRRALVQRAEAAASAAVPCPVGCGALLPHRRVDRERHAREACPLRLLRCGAAGCGVAVTAGAMAEHVATVCAATRASRRVLAAAAARPTHVRCSGCHAAVAVEALRWHVEQECPQRLVACPHAEGGCGAEVAACDLPAHLLRDCRVKRERDERADRSLERMQMTQCRACGRRLQAHRLRAHALLRCPNRVVPCKHWELGCRARVRLGDMRAHLAVDAARRRPCLLLGGGQAYVYLGERDVPPPWTAEFWVYRLPLVDEVREQMRETLLEVWRYQEGVRMQEAATAQIAALEETLRAATDLSAHAEVTDALIRAAGQRDDGLLIMAVACSRADALSKAVMRGLATLRSSKPNIATTPTTPAAAATTVATNGGASPGHASSTYGWWTQMSLARTCTAVYAAQQPPDPSNSQSPQPPPATAAAAAAAAPPPTAAAAAAAAAASAAAPPNATAAAGSAMNDADAISGSTAQLVTAAAPAVLSADAPVAALAAAAPAKYWAPWLALCGTDTVARFEQAVVAAELPRMRASVVPSLSDGAREGSSAGGGGGRDSAGGSRGGRKAERKRQRQQERVKSAGAEAGLNARIKQALHCTSCQGTLAGSEGALLGLQVGEQGRVGIVAIGRREIVFNHACPRERWVHLAVTASETALELFQDGRSVDRLPLDASEVPALPMGHFGGTRGTAACLLQEIRYWVVQRGPKELEHSMHKLLPDDATHDGLLGYWTFEEGEGVYTFDATAQRPRAVMAGAAVAWAASEAQERGDPPTPSWQERHVCAVEMRRARLALRGRAHLLIAPCPRACGQEVAIKDLRLHLARQCARREVTCTQPGCSAKVPLDALDAHIQDDCAPHKAMCALAAKGDMQRDTVTCDQCHAQYPRKLHLHHQREACEWRLVHCHLCEVLMAANRVERHVAHFCRAEAALVRRAQVARGRQRWPYERPWVLSDADAAVAVAANLSPEALTMLYDASPPPSPVLMPVPLPVPLPWRVFRVACAQNVGPGRKDARH